MGCCIVVATTYGNVSGADNARDLLTGREPTHVWDNLDGSRTYRYDSGSRTSYERRSAEEISAQDEFVAQVAGYVIINGIDLACQFYDWLKSPECGETKKQLNDWLKSPEFEETKKQLRLAADQAIVKAKNYWPNSDLKSKGVRQAGTELVSTAKPTSISGPATPRSVQVPTVAQKAVTECFTDNGDGTMTDKQTGLEWVKEPHSLPGNSGEMDWDRAVEFCTNLVYAGHSDWRLPDKDVLVAQCRLKAYFVGVRQSELYWSGTTYSPSTAWRVSTGSGCEYNYSKASYNYVWPMRGGQ